VNGKSSYNVIALGAVRLRTGMFSHPGRWRDRSKHPPTTRNWLGSALVVSLTWADRADSPSTDDTETSIDSE